MPVVASGVSDSRGGVRNRSVSGGADIRCALSADGSLVGGCSSFWEVNHLADEFVRLVCPEVCADFFGELVCSGEDPASHDDLCVAAGADLAHAVDHLADAGQVCCGGGEEEERVGVVHLDVGEDFV